MAIYTATLSRTAEPMRETRRHIKPIDLSGRNHGERARYKTHPRPRLDDSYYSSQARLMITRQHWIECLNTVCTPIHALLLAQFLLLLLVSIYLSLQNIRVM
jgi:hypothetical protein